MHTPTTTLPSHKQGHEKERTSWCHTTTRATRSGTWCQRVFISFLSNVCKNIKCSIKKIELHSLTWTWIKILHIMYQMQNKKHATYILAHSHRLRWSSPGTCLYIMHIISIELDLNDNQMCNANCDIKVKDHLTQWAGVKSSHVSMCTRWNALKQHSEAVSSSRATDMFLTFCSGLMPREKG